MARNYFLVPEYEDPSFKISTNFTLFLNQMPSYYHQPIPQISMVAFCPQSSSLGYNNSSTSDEANEKHTGIINQRKQRRMISNHESARRSGMRKRKQLDELCVHVLWLRSENHGLVEKFNRLAETYEQVIQENDRIKNETMKLRQLVSETTS